MSRFTKRVRPSARRAPRRSPAAAILGLACTLALSPSGALGHHTPGHDQNPSPPAPLGTVDVVSFEAGSLIIPMDGCYQRPGFMNTTEVTNIIGEDPGDAECNANNDRDDGIIPAYSLIYRLVLDGIPVHWSIRDGKGSFHDVDFAITRAGGGPVVRIDRNGSTTKTYTSLTEIKYRGAPFIIDSDDAANALTLMQSYNQSAFGTDYDEVDIHRAEIDFDAPVFTRIEQLPKLAVIDVTHGPTDLRGTEFDKLQGSIEEALMDDLEGPFFEYVTIPQVNSNYLIDNDFTLVWVPPFDLQDGTTPTPAQQTFLDNLGAYVDAGGAILFQDGAVGALEGHGSFSGSYSEDLAPTAGYQSDGGITPNGVNGTWDNGNASENTVGQDYSDPASQFGGIVWTGIGGSKFNWRPRQDRAYRPGVRRMIYTDHATDNSQDNWDLATWRRKDNDPNKGIIYYLGGFHWRKVTASGFRVLMNTVLATAAELTPPPPATPPPTPGVARRISRSAPILVSEGGTDILYQGTLDVPSTIAPAPTYSGAADDSTFTFPDRTGNLRAFDITTPPPAGTSLDDLVPVLDAAASIPPVTTAGCGVNFSGSCRTVFTDTTGGTSPTRTFFNTTNVGAIGGLLGTFSTDESRTLISRVLAGVDDGAGGYTAALGAVDRSTPAIIGPSPFAGGERPTIAYFGALDGMLHAVCVNDIAPCPAPGVELWAFLPRTQLPLLKMNAQRIDGSPRVADINADFGLGRREFRTVLTFQTGSGDPTDPAAAPATIALDITDPANPLILWERTTPASPGAFELGIGLDIAMATVGATPLTFVQTANGGTGATGFVVEAIETATGATSWTFTQAYPAPRTPGNPPVPATAIPAGVALVSTTAAPEPDLVLVPSLYGELWVLNAADGTNPFINQPIYRSLVDFRPVGSAPAVYRDVGTQALHAAIATGGYADPVSTTWAPSDVQQTAVSIPLNIAVASAPLTEDNVGDQGGFVFFFPAGERAFASPVIVGNELVVVTDTEDANFLDAYGAVNSGRLRRLSLSSGSQVGTTAETASGAGGIDASVDANGNLSIVAGGGATGGAQVDAADFDETGSALVDAVRGVQRLIWLEL